MLVAIAAPHNRRGRKCHPGLTLRARAGNKRRRCSFRFPPRAHDAPTSREKPGESGWSLARFILLLMMLAWVLRSFIAAPFSIPSGSMLPTLYIGDYLVVAKWPYGYSRYSFPFGFPSFDGRVSRP